MRILLLDLETAPNIATVWGIYDQTIAINQLLESSYVLCWAAKWLGDDEIMWRRSHGKSGRYRKDMLRAVHKLLDEADAVIHYNGKSFDIPTLNKEFILHDMAQPAPYKQIDLIKVARSQFRFTSNKLDYIVQFLGLGEKVKHRGHEMWLDCMNNDPKAWAEMEAYNKHDVTILEKLYYRLRPWIKTHVSYSAHEGLICCPHCGSGKWQRRGYAIAPASKYQRYQCQDCGTWFRSGPNLLPRGKVAVTC